MAGKGDACTVLTIFVIAVVQVSVLPARLIEHGLTSAQHTIDYMTDACIPSVFMSALVRPLLKNAALYASQLKNFRPLSDPSFLSKLFKRTVQVRLRDSSTSAPRHLAESLYHMIQFQAHHFASGIIVLKS